jgi:hypothetical protein
MIFYFIDQQELLLSAMDLSIVSLKSKKISSEEIA